jgi:hypothetical protein
MLTFAARAGYVWLVTERHEHRLTDGQTDRFLDLLEECGAAEDFNRLYQVQKQALGEDFIPRVSPLIGLRLVTENPAREVVGAMLAACPEVNKPNTGDAA